MIRSMTGYGRAEKIIDGREITVELRAVNNRYLDLNVKLPRVYGFVQIIQLILTAAFEEVMVCFI